MRLVLLMLAVTAMVDSRTMMGDWASGFIGLMLLALPSFAKKAWAWYWKAFTVPARPASTQPCS